MKRNIWSSFFIFLSIFSLRISGAFEKTGRKMKMPSNVIERIAFTRMTLLWMCITVMNESVEKNKKETHDGE